VNAHGRNLSTTAALLVSGLLLTLAAAPAQAQMEEDLIPRDRSFVSPEHLALELRLGPYEPQMGGEAFDTFFDDDSGPLMALELDVIAFRLPDIVYLLGGGGIGWMQFDGKAVDSAGEETSEDTELEIVPLNLLAVARVDVLARKLGIPFLLTGKIGYQWASWSTKTGSSPEKSGWSVGLLWALQVALDLDFFEPSAARTMDEEWGVNHSFLFFELFGFEPSGDSLEIGDTTWSMGLGFMI